jgi:hypothetical protein
MIRTWLGVSLLLGVPLAVPAQDPAAPAAPLVLRAGDLRVVLGETASAAERRAAALLVAEVQRRTGLEVPSGAAAAGRIALLVGTADSSAALRAFRADHPETGELGPDGYHIATQPDQEQRLFVLGQSPSGVVAGVGRLLRTLHYAAGELTIPALSLSAAPRLPVRGIYFATHFYNFYHVAPLAEVDQVIEEFALWGGNSLCVWFDMHHFTSLSDPQAQAHLERLQHFAATAHGVGMQFGLTFIANEAYAGSPAALRPKPSPGSYGVELCPSIPAGLELIGKWQAEVLDAFPRVDFIWAWPYDQGGCACERCTPWGANGFLVAAEQLARLFHERVPAGKVWLSTWLLDFMAGNSGEYAGLFRYIGEKQPEWFQGILAGTHGDTIPAPLLERPQPERYPLTWFPEISMWGMEPWGGYGANPLPTLCTRLRERLGAQTQGGWPYSEGIYEDLNKFLWCQFYVSPERATDDILADYASYYLSPAAAADGVRLFHLLEQTHLHTNWRAPRLGVAEEAWALAQSLDGRLPGWARSSWRWRLIYIRAALDHILKTQGYRTPAAQAALQPLAAEITAIYHAQQTFIRSPDLPAPRAASADNLAQGCPLRASSTHPEYSGCEPALTDGVYAQEDGENFWVHDVRKEPTAWVVIDLGKPLPLKEVRLQYRGLYGTFWFIPTTLSFAVSADGETWEEAGSSEVVPKEGTPYSPAFWDYRLGKNGRFLRVSLGTSQHVGDAFAGTLELVEVEVRGW